MKKFTFPINRIEEKNITKLALWGDTLLSESWTVSGITADSSFASAACCIEIKISRKDQIMTFFASSLPSISIWKKGRGGGGEGDITLGRILPVLLHQQEILHSQSHRCTLLQLLTHHFQLQRPIKRQWMRN